MRTISGNVRTDEVYPAAFGSIIFIDIGLHAIKRGTRSCADTRRRSTRDVCRYLAARRHARRGCAGDTRASARTRSRHGHVGVRAAGVCVRSHDRRRGSGDSSGPRFAVSKLIFALLVRPTGYAEVPKVFAPGPGTLRPGSPRANIIAECFFGHLLHHRSAVPRLAHPGAEFVTKTAAGYGFGRLSGSGGYQLVYESFVTGFRPEGCSSCSGSGGSLFCALYQKSTLVKNVLPRVRNKEG